MTEVLESGVANPVPCLARSQIEQLLPHRGEILFLRTLRLHSDRHFSGIARWDAGQMGLAGHFPEMSVVPAVFLVEAAAQLAGAGTLATREHEEHACEYIGVLASIRKCAFHQLVPVGRDVEIDARVRQVGTHVVLVEATAAVGSVHAATIEVILGEVPVKSLMSALESEP